MDKKTKKMLVIGGVLAAIGGVYLYNKNQPAAAPSSSGPMDGTAPVSTPAMLNAPVQQAAPPSLPITTGNGSQLQTVAAWVVSDGSPSPMMAMLQAADPAEIAGMYDIITMNLWGDSATITPNLPQGAVTFWNTLINKYDPQHKFM